ncbi:MAG: LacI family DNA-binding transcriptional regulator [Beijerinckiaceae bacterium]
MTDVALEAGVSPATVSRAHSQPELLAKETLERVQQAARRLGYRPDGMARALASGRTMAIGAVFPTLDNAIFSRALQAMQAELTAAGYHLLVVSHDYSASAEAEAVRNLLARGVDGLVLVGAERAAETNAMLRDAAAPVVLTWCDAPGFSAVAVDNARAGRLAAEHLLRLGHRRIGMITGRLGFNDRQRARLAGARAAIADAGLTLPDWRVTQQPMTLAGGRTGAARLLELAEPPTALIGGIDVIAIGAMIEAGTRGLSVPDQISVVGIDDIEMSAHVAPALSTVHIPTAAIGAEAACILIELLRGETGEMHRELPVELVERRSTGPAPGG